MNVRFLVLMSLLSTAFAGKGQNLVLNGDFEQGCPNGLGNIDAALYWHYPTAAEPDYFNVCSTSTFSSVPDNYCGYQYPHGGNGYAGLERFDKNFLYREYIEGTLTAPLVAGTCYHVEMYINLANKSAYTATALGVYFSDTLITGILGYNALPYVPQVTNTSSVYPDTISWTLINETFYANGGENYIIIGNFYPDSLTDTVFYNMQSLFLDSYIFIDDVSLTPCTGIEEQNNSEAINIYPNPVKDELKIQNAGLRIKEIKIYDVMGKEVFAQSNIQSSIFNIQSLKSGIYFLEINTGKDIFRKKFIKE